MLQAWNGDERHFLKTRDHISRAVDAHKAFWAFSAEKGMVVCVSTQPGGIGVKGCSELC